MEAIMLEKIRYNLQQNLARVENLVTTYETHPHAQGRGRKNAAVLDILRAAVVLLHATLEELLRSVAYWKLPMAQATVLNDIALVGFPQNSKKFLLGDLSPYRGKSVDDILTASVNAYLEKSNFNNRRDIISLLENVGIDVTKVNANFDDLQSLMERRHQIVHRADRQSKVVGRGDHEVRGIHKETVRTWAKAVNQFALALSNELSGSTNEKNQATPSNR